jgi:thiol-disulfide isomerase/thioredoxin
MQLKALILSLVTSLAVATALAAEPKPAAPKQAEPKPAPLRIGEKVPDFTVADVSGKTWKLSVWQKSSRSGVVSLTFWCSFCHSCRHMESRLDKFAQAYRDRVMVAAWTPAPGKPPNGWAPLPRARA